MHISGEINELAEALAKAQGAMSNAQKEGYNTHLKSHYTTLTSVWDACRIPLSENALSVVQLFEQDSSGHMQLVTVLMHKSGQRIQNDFPIPVAAGNMQAMGGNITYARRYALMAILGISADSEDDDGEGSKHQPVQQPARNENGNHRPSEEARRNTTQQRTPVQSPSAARAEAKDSPTVAADKRFLDKLNAFKAHPAVHSQIDINDAKQVRGLIAELLQQPDWKISSKDLVGLSAAYDFVDREYQEIMAEGDPFEDKQALPFTAEEQAAAVAVMPGAFRS